MDTERLKINAEIYGTKLKAKIRLLVGLCGLIMLGLGAYNFLAVPALGTEAWAPYRIGATVVKLEGEQAVLAVEDVVVMSVGAVMVWVS